MTDLHLPAVPGRRTVTWHELAAALGPAAPPMPAAPVHVIAVDGFSGSGKTWFAERLARTLGAPIFHVDEFIPGWDALADGVAHVATHLLTPWAQGQPALVREYDWHGARPGPWVHAEPAPVVVLEGSGIGTVDPSLISALVWVDTPQALREDRLAGREDRDLYAPYREIWAAQERAVTARADTPARADVVVHEAGETHLRTSCRGAERT